jgi:hypothetical protein
MAPGRRRTGRLGALLLLPMLLGGCTYYQVAPGTYAGVPSAGFDRSWSAVLGALDDQRVRVTREDRSAGVVQGNRDGIELTASVRTQADGSVRVEFGTAGATARDPGLIDRVHRAYERRMGR